MKNNDRLFDEIGNIDDALIPAIVKEKGKRKPLIIGACGLAAAAAVGFAVTRGLGFGTVPWEDYRIYPAFDYREDIAIKDELPQIPHIVHDPGIDWSAGVEAVPALFYKDDVEKNLSSNPWNKRLNGEAPEEAEIGKLPVFKNNFFDEYGPALYGHLSEEELTRMLNNTATALGLNLGEPEFYYDKLLDEELPIWLSAECDGEKYGVEEVHITVYSGGNVRISFIRSDDGGYKMPEINGLDEEEVLKLLTERFGNLIQYEDPVIKTFKEIGISGYVLYDASEDLIQDLLNYSFASVSFSFNEENDLCEINLYNSLLGAECVAEYPIISLDSAENLLNRGVYLKCFPDTFFKNGVMNADDIAGAELVYYSSMDEYFKPYYRFYIELGYTDSDGNTLYGDLYVPAIEGKYVENGSIAAPDFTGEAYEAFPDTVSLPDGSAVGKDEACGVYMRNGVPMLEFNFGFMRYAEPICINTLYHPECFDFDTMTFKEPIDTEIPDPEYFMVKAGDYLMADGGGWVKSAKYSVTLENGEPEFYSCEITVTGLAFSGVITCETEEPEPGEEILGEPQKLIYFYADPVDSRDKPIPLIYSPDKPQVIEKVLEEDALITDGFKSCINRITPYDVDAVMLGYTDILDGTKARIALMQTGEVTYISNAEGTGTYVHMLEFMVKNNKEG